MLACAVLILSPTGAVQAETLKIGGTGSVLGSMRLLGPALDIGLGTHSLKDKERDAGGRVEVGVAVDIEGRPSISVSDTGIGIAPGDLEKALEPFGQIDSSLARKFEGSGLGLSLAKSLAELHEGHIENLSEIGAGTRATVYFPTHRLVAASEIDGAADRAVSA